MAGRGFLHNFEKISNRQRYDLKYLQAKLEKCRSKAVHHRRVGDVKRAEYYEEICWWIEENMIAIAVARRMER